MRWIFLLAGLAVGYAVGTTTDSHTPRATRQAPRDVAGRLDPVAAPEATRPGTPVADKADGTTAPAPPSPSISTSASTSPTTSDGILEVAWPADGPGIEISLHGKGLRGEEEQIDAPGDTVTPLLKRWSLPQGNYRVRARRHEWPRERNWFLRIEAGGFLRIDLSLPPDPQYFPIPAGLGRLSFSVFGIDGQPLPDVHVHILGTFVGKLQDVGEDANGAGCGRVHLRPGDYRVRVGAQEQRVKIVAGEVTSAVFRYGGEGALVVEGLGAERVDLSGPAAYERGGGRIVYASPGRFDVVLNDAGRHDPFVVGQVDIYAGLVTTFRYEPLLGEVRVTLRPSQSTWPGNARVRLVPAGGGDVIELRPQTTLAFGNGGVLVFGGAGGVRLGMSVHARYLPLGRYRVEFEANDWNPATTEVEVNGEGRTDVELPISPVR